MTYVVKKKRPTKKQNFLKIEKKKFEHKNRISTYFIFKLVQFWHFDVIAYTILFK